VKKTGASIVTWLWLLGIVAYVLYVRATPRSPLGADEVAVTYDGTPLRGYDIELRDTIQLVTDGRVTVLVLARTTCEVCMSRIADLASVVRDIHADVNAIVLFGETDEPMKVAARAAGITAPFVTLVDSAEWRHIGVRYVPTLAIFQGRNLIYAWAGLPGRREVRRANKLIRAANR